MNMNRSFHFLPADNTKFLEKSKGIDADILIYDLEDAVAETNKNLARKNISNLNLNSNHIFIRINSFNSKHIEEDLKLVKTLPSEIGIVLPKTQSITNITDVIKQLNRNIKIITLIENITALTTCNQFLSHPMIFAAGLGVEDLLTNLPYKNDNLNVLIDSLRFELIKYSWTNKILPIDIISTETKDISNFQSDCLKSRSMGFTAKFSIHPNQLNTINNTFCPNSEELEWANTITAHSRDENSGYKIHEDGILTTPPKIKKALNILKYEE